MADVSIVSSAVANTPQDYTLPGAQEILLVAVGCTVNGTNAAGTFLPALQMLDPAGHVMWTAVNASVPVAAGGTALVSWFPGGGVGRGTGTSGAGTINEITSTGSTIAVGNPSGPTTNVDLPATGVTPATYGDSTHVSQVVVNAEGVVTSAANVAIAGVAPGMAQIFDSTLAVAAASIDTGAGGVTAGYSGLMVVAVGRAAGAFFSGSFNLVFNNDTAANYQYIWTDNSNGVSSSFISTAQNATKIMEGPGSSIGAGIFGVASVFIPAYTQTTADKAITSLGGFAETSGHSELVHLVGTWNNTAAITRIAFNTGIGNLVAGSRLTIYGLP